MPVFIIETESRFKMQYAVEADSFESAFKAVRSGGVEDFHQEHIGEFLIDGQVVTDEELVYQIRKSTALYQSWSDEKLLEVFKNVH